MLAAKAWATEPSRWDDLESEDKAEMIAVFEVERDMAAWEQAHPTREVNMGGATKDVDSGERTE